MRQLSPTESATTPRTLRGWCQRRATGNPTILGIFDSGLGGLTVVRDVRARLPEEDLVFLADQAHVPYGDRSDDELRSYLADNVAFLNARGASAIVMGCNTTCAIGRSYGWPASAAPILDLIEAAADVVASLGVRHVGVLATNATARSGAYRSAIRARAPRIAVEEVGTPELVPLVEAGRLEGDDVRAAVAQACARFHGPLEAVVLACTHFPLLDAHFAAVLGPSIVRIDPARAQAERAARFVQERAGEGEAAREPGATTYVSNGEPGAFARAVENICGPLGPRDRIEAFVLA